MVFSALFLFILIGFAAYFYRDDIFQSLQDPGVPFQTYTKPPAPDYTQDSAWLSRPDITADSFLADAPGDAFIVVPGVYRGGKHWVLPVDVDRRRERLQNIVRPNYVAPYAYAGRTFAPYYRHAAMYSYMTNREDARRARAYGSFMPSDKRNARRFSTRALAYNGEKYMAINGGKTLCTNPLLWSRSEDYAVPRLHKGGMAAVGIEPDSLPPPLPKQTGAQCEDGLLLVDKPRSRSLRRPLGIGARFWTLPSNLFFEDCLDIIRDGLSLWNICLDYTSICPPLVAGYLNAQPPQKVPAGYHLISGVTLMCLKQRNCWQTVMIVRQAQNESGAKGDMAIVYRASILSRHDWDILMALYNR